MTKDRNFRLPYNTYYIVTILFKDDPFEIPDNVKIYAENELEARNSVYDIYTELFGPNSIIIIKITKQSINIDDEDITLTLFEENNHMCDCVGNLDRMGETSYISVVRFGRKIHGMRFNIKTYSDDMDKAEQMIRDYCRLVHRHLGKPIIVYTYVKSTAEDLNS